MQSGITSAAVLWLVICLISCHLGKNDAPQEEVAIARVGDRTLSTSTLEQVIHSTSSPEDSIAMATAYIDQWTRDQLMMQEASRLFITDREVERMVIDFRERLLMHQLETKIVEERFDTLVTTDQMISFYETMKSQFTLSEPVFRCLFVKFSRDTKSLDQFYKDWKKDDDHAIRTFASAYSVEMQIDTTQWRSWTEVQSWCSTFSSAFAKSGRAQRQIDKEYQYYLKIEESVDKADFSPLGYIAPQLKRMLLHSRRQKLVEEYKQELYEKALRQNKIQL